MLNGEYELYEVKLFDGVRLLDTMCCFAENENEACDTLRSFFIEEYNGEYDLKNLKTVAKLIKYKGTSSFSF